MSRKSVKIVEGVKVEKLVHGGQALGVLPDGRKVFVWNALPNEVVAVELTKSKKDYAEGIAVDIEKSNPDRTGSLGREDVRLSVAPWSIMDYKAELNAKAAILEEAFRREGLDVDTLEVNTCGAIEAYRNKVEFSFWGDDEGLHFAHYVRASHQKIRLEYPYNPLISDRMADTAATILAELHALDIRAGDLKSLILRCDGNVGPESKVVAALFVKPETFPTLKYQDIAVVHSNPKSPASVRTKDIYINGDITLTDQLMGRNIMYDVFSFFQVNLPVFEMALRSIDSCSGDYPKIDMYSGVGTVGLSLGATDKIVELDKNNVAYAKINAKNLNVEVIHAASEQALEHIDSKHSIVVDPPRAGLHKDVVDSLLDTLPPQIIYLSCNPSTQARDVALLSHKYKIRVLEGYNFFPRTPHIESLVVLEVKTSNAGVFGL